MSQLFESLDSSDRAWENRVLQRSSLCSLFLGVLLLVFMLGLAFGTMLYGLVGMHHRFHWDDLGFLLVGIPTFAYARIIYRRLPAKSTEKE